MAWSGTPAQAAASIPMMAADGVTAINSAANYRQGFLGAFLTRAAGGSPMAWRQGVLVTSQSAGSAVVPADLLTGPTTPVANNMVNLQPGTVVFSRSGIAGGAYTATWNAPVSIKVDPGDNVNPRIDTVVATLTDAFLGDSGTQGAAISIINGTATTGATLVNLSGAATVPLTTVVLAYILQPVSSTTVGASQIQPSRDSTSVLGSIRPLLEGDTAAEPGNYYGEYTFDAVTSFKRGLCWWDGGQWRGTQRTTYTGVNGYGGGTVFNWLSGSSPSYLVSQALIPDPGFPYKIEVSFWACGSNAGSGMSEWAVRLDNFVSGAIIGMTTASTPGFWSVAMPGAVSGTLSGAHSVDLCLSFFAMGSGSTLTQTSFGQGVGLTVDVIPV